MQDNGQLDVVLEGGPDASFSEMVRLQARVTDAFRHDPSVLGVSAVLGIGPLNATTNVGHLGVTLTPPGERTLDATRIAERLKQSVADIPGVTLFIKPVQDVQITTRPSRSQYQYTLTGSDADEVASWSRKLLDRLRQDGTVRNLANETQEGGLRTLLTIDREAAGRLGITAQNIDDTLNDAFGQRQISTIYAQSNQYRVVLEAAPRYQTDPSALDKLYVSGTTGGPQTPLAVFTRAQSLSAPLAVAHQDQFPAGTLSFDLAEGASLGDAVAAVARAQDEIGMPATVAGSFSADAAEFTRSLASEPLLILAALVTIYLVLGILYESFAHPFTILTTLPSAGVGALLALILTGHDLSVVALIGIILLMGIVKKNAIMMIDFALDAERNAGLSAREAIVRAARLRFRPIMMTTLAALFGAVPLAFAHGTGSELRVPLGITIIGGLVLSQLLTLYTTPVIYLAVERLRVRMGADRERPVAFAEPIPSIEQSREESREAAE